MQGVRVRQHDLPEPVRAAGLRRPRPGGPQARPLPRGPGARRGRPQADRPAAALGAAPNPVPPRPARGVPRRPGGGQVGQHQPSLSSDMKH